MRLRKYLQIVFFITFIICCSARIAIAVPALQLYVDGANYDPITETWVTLHMSEFDLQVIGAQEIDDVSIAIAVREGESGTITIDSTPIGPFTFFGTPIMGDGNPLPFHGIYPAYFTTYPIGDFGLVETVYNMSPGETGSALGEIKTFDISISGYTWAHFDAFDHVELNDKHVKYVFAPFSHDAEASPEPATLSLLGLGLLGFGVFKRKKGI